MKEIEVVKWKVKHPETGEEIEESILTLIDLLISNKKPEDLPKGLESFRIFHRISIAFENAEKMGKLSLEDKDYEFIKGMFEKDMPGQLGFNKNIVEAVENFLSVR